MSLEFALRPSSIEGIKRLADRIEREESIKRAEALERASRSAGFSNYAHARRSLAESPRPRRGGTTSTSRRTGTIYPPAKLAERRW